MGFKASFLFAICLLILGDALAKLGEKKKEPKKEEPKKVDNGRRNQQDVKLFTCDDQCLSRLHNNSRNDLADGLIVPRSVQEIDNFFIKHIPLIEDQRLMAYDNNWSEYAAVWLIKGQLANFQYAPPHPNADSNVAWVDNHYTCAPPRTDVNENYLLARPEWWPSKKVAQERGEGPLHAEWIIHNQVATYNDLKAYVQAQKPINYVMMFSFKHPCRDCANLLVDILDQIKQANGKDLALPCHLGWRAMWDGDDDNVNAQVLQPGGITRVAKFGGLGQKLRP